LPILAGFNRQFGASPRGNPEVQVDISQIKSGFEKFKFSFANLKLVLQNKAGTHERNKR